MCFSHASDNYALAIFLHTKAICEYYNEWLESVAIQFSLFFFFFFQLSYSVFHSTARKTFEVTLTWGRNWLNVWCRRQLHWHRNLIATNKLPSVCRTMQFENTKILLENTPQASLHQLECVCSSFHGTLELECPKIFKKKIIYQTMIFMI